MASKLEDKLNKRLVRGPGGQLVESTDEELQKVSEQAGLPAAPTSPLAAKIAGAGPDAAKMAGTGIQKDIALNQAIDPSQTLQSAQRLAQGRSTMTGDETVKLEKSENLQSLGQLGDRVQGLIVSKLPAGSAPTNLSLRDEYTKGIEQVKIDANKSILDAFNSGNQETIDQALLNYEKNTGEILDPSQIPAMFNSPEEAIAKMVQSNLGEQVLLDDILKMEGSKELADSITASGIDPKGKTLQQFQLEVEASLDEEYSRVEELERLANDPNGSAASRTAARQELRDMGAAGVRSVEADVEELEASITEADEIELFGQTMSIEELLDDEGMSGMVATYYDDPDVMKKIKEENPTFAKFLEDNRTALEGAVQDLEGSAEAYQTTQAENKEVAKYGESGTVNDDAMKIFNEEWGNPSLTKFEKPNVGIFNAIEAGKGEEEAHIINTLNVLGKNNPEFLDKIKDMDISQLREIGATSPDGPFSTFLKEMTNSKGVLDPNNPLHKAFMDSGAMDDPTKFKKEVPSLISKYQGLEALGIKPGQSTPYENNLTIKYKNILADGVLEVVEVEQLATDGKAMNYLLDSPNIPSEVKSVLKDRIEANNDSNLSDLMSGYTEFEDYKVSGNFKEMAESEKNLKSLEKKLLDARSKRNDYDTRDVKDLLSKVQKQLSILEGDSFFQDSKSGEFGDLLNTGISASGEGGSRSGGGKSSSNNLTTAIDKSSGAEELRKQLKGGGNSGLKKILSGGLL